MDSLMIDGGGAYYCPCPQAVGGGESGVWLWGERLLLLPSPLGLLTVRVPPVLGWQVVVLTRYCW